LPGNRLVITTHSPYLINYLTLAIKASALRSRYNNPQMDKALEGLGFRNDTLVNAEDAAVYELDAKDGSIRRLEMPNGLPSDENRLNVELGETNETFAKLLELQDRFAS
jgi:hypothetical protein